MKLEKWIMCHEKMYNTIDRKWHWRQKVWKFWNCQIEIAMMAGFNSLNSIRKESHFVTNLSWEWWFSYSLTNYLVMNGVWIGILPNSRSFGNQQEYISTFFESPIFPIISTNFLWWVFFRLNQISCVFVHSPTLYLSNRRSTYTSLIQTESEKENRRNLNLTKKRTVQIFLVIQETWALPH